MKNVFKPSVKLMNRLRYHEKFILIFIVFLLPITVMMFLNIVQADREVRYANKQRIGLEYNIKLRAIIQHIQEHRGLTAVYLGGNESLKTSIEKKEVEIQNDIEEFNKLNQKYDQELNVGSSWASISSKWQDLLKDLPLLTLNQAFERHTSLISEMISFNIKVSDNTKLVLQSQLEPYYLANSIVNILPQFTEYMGQARAIGAGAAGKKYVSQDEKDMLQALTSAISRSIKEQNSSMYVAFNNKEVKNTLELPIENAFRASQGMVETINKEFINSRSITIDSDDYFLNATEAINKIYELIITESNVVDKMLREDSSALETRRNLLIGFTAATLSLIIYLFAGFYYSVNSGIKAIENVSEKISSGIFSERVNLDAKDESQKIGDALNRMLDALVASFNSEKEAKKNFETLAHHDFLTGIPNRAMFIKSLKETIADAEISKSSFALLFMDLDRFKFINDTLGHHMGDLVLKLVALRLSEVLCGMGQPFRIAGDEFTVILPCISSESEVKEVISQISDAVEKPMLLNNTEYNVGVSIGFTIYPKDAVNSDELIRKSDEAMYQRKQDRKKLMH